MRRLPQRSKWSTWKGLCEDMKDGLCRKNVCPWLGKYENKTCHFYMQDTLMNSNTHNAVSKPENDWKTLKDSLCHLTCTIHSVYTYPEHTSYHLCTQPLFGSSRLSSMKEWPKGANSPKKIRLISACLQKCTSHAVSTKELELARCSATDSAHDVYPRLPHHRHSYFMHPDPLSITKLDAWWLP